MLKTLALSREANMASPMLIELRIIAFKLEIVLKLAHLLGPLEQTTNSCTLDHPISDHAG